MTEAVLVRAASTIILVKDAKSSPSVLMGQRGKGAVFMPRKYVFPGGAVDGSDSKAAISSPLDTRTRSLLALAPGSAIVAPEAMGVAALRELQEETGLAFPGQPISYDLHALRFFMRAITPPGRPRRFDARFFLAPADALEGGADALLKDSDELSNVHWVPLENVEALDLAPVTAMVLERLAEHLPSLETPSRVPLVRRDRIEDQVVWLEAP